MSEVVWCHFEAGIEEEDGTADPTLAVRREWWYEPGETYVYQERETPDEAWGPLLCEYEDDPVPEWVREAVSKWEDQ